MIHKILFASTLCLAALTANAEATAATGAVKTIPHLDLPRYMGTWHEIARFPNRFQKQCAGEVSADYTLLPGGSVQVLNRCRLDNGGSSEALGEGKQLGGASSARLTVRFAPAWLSFLPFVWGDYWIVDLDPDYQLAAVSDAQRQYLWVLSRTPQVDGQRYAQLVQRLAAQGFDTRRLVLTRQE